MFGLLFFKTNFKDLINKRDDLSWGDIKPRWVGKYLLPETIKWYFGTASPGDRGEIAKVFFREKFLTRKHFVLYFRDVARELTVYV